MYRYYIFQEDADMKRRIFSILICFAVMLSFPLKTAFAESSDSVIKSLFSGEAYADAWTAAVTVMNPDRALFTEENMVRVNCKSDEAPYFVLSSSSGGAQWAMATPSNKINDNYYYSYEDMVSVFGSDMSLLDYISVMAQNAPVTVYSIDIVPEDSVSAPENESGGEKRVVGYLPDWSYQAYRNLDFSTLTHINIAFCNPDTSGNISCYIPDDELNKIVETAHANGVKVLAALGGGGGCDNYPPLLSSTDSMNAFNEKIMAYCEKYNLDGIDLDIELGSSSSIWDNYGEWCQSLRKLCDERDFLMTTATAQWVAVRVSAETFELFDFINVMAYDNDGDPSSHASYEFAVESLKYFNIQRGIPKNKLVLGVPFYGRGYNADGSLNWNSYVSFSELISSDAENYNRDEYNGVAYNGAASIAEKCSFAKDYGGIMIWEISQDASGEYSLLQVIKKGILTDDEVLMGDVNLDNSIGSADLVLLSKYLLVESELTTEQGKRADINSDVIVDCFDLILLKALIINNA